MVWPVLSFRDAHKSAAFLRDAFGFEEVACYTREDDPAIVEHGELRWPLGGGVMFGTAGKDDSPFGARTPGNDSVYVVCDEPDALFEPRHRGRSRRRARAGRRGLRVARLHGEGPRGQPLELRDLSAASEPAAAARPRRRS